MAVLFQDEIASGISFNMGPKNSENLSFEPLTTASEIAIIREFRKNLFYVDNICPSIMGQLEEQETAFVKLAAVVLAEWEHDPKDLVVAGCRLKETDVFFSWISSDMIKYAVIPNKRKPCFSDYRYGSFEMQVTKGKPAYLLGSEDNYYRGCNEPGRRCAFVLAEDGFAECSDHGKIESLWIEFEGETARAPAFQNPMGELPKTNSAIRKWTVLDSMGRETVDLYQYRTTGMMYVPVDAGVKIWVIPSETGIIKPIPLGFGFCESGFVKKYLDRRGAI